MMHLYQIVIIRKYDGRIFEILWSRNIGCQSSKMMNIDITQLKNLEIYKYIYKLQEFGTAEVL